MKTILFNVDTGERSGGVLKNGYLVDGKPQLIDANVWSTKVYPAGWKKL